MPEDEGSGNKDRDFVAKQTANEVTPEVEPGSLSIEGLPGMVGLVKTPEMLEIQGKLTEAIASGQSEVRIALTKQFHELADQLVEQFRDDEYGRAQIGQVVAMAMIRRDGGQVDFYFEELDEALTAAVQSGYDDLAQIIRAELDSAVKNSPNE